MCLLSKFVDILLAELTDTRCQALSSVSGLASMQASAIRNHAASRIHQVAVAAYYSPGGQPEELLLQNTEDQGLLQGRGVESPGGLRICSVQLGVCAALIGVSRHCFHLSVAHA